ncbi:hypothetical protein F8388_013882 [Cannabis sativa]|uniref:CCHC-type domain-containing protein n=1 Tax=Cannabis sativa TaxID=3483 RepID=A0A7J6E911_CANSA|nr:hypothetical protein F8388_013882 [Cannabis sativa]
MARSFNHPSSSTSLRSVRIWVNMKESTVGTKPIDNIGARVEVASFGATKLTGNRSPFMGRVSSTNSIVIFLGIVAFFFVFSMDLELVNRLAEVLVLDEGDDPVLSLNKAGIEEGKRRMDLCLVGKVIGPRPANKEGIEKAMKMVWKLHHRFQVEELSSKNVFRFFFGSREDRQRVYGGGPWTFDKQLIYFVKPMGLGEISKMNFDFTSFWISINNVPLACMTELFAREWGEQIGKLEDIKIVNGAMKVRVRINITEPLKRGLRVAVDDQGNEVSLIFQYEHLPDFCYDCGIIRHKALDCPLRDFAGDNPKFDSGRFDSWMCAPSSPPPDQYRVQRNRESSPLDRPIMTMGEASRIIAAVGRNRVRYSGPTSEELDPIFVLEARKQSVIPVVERDMELSKVSSALDGSTVVESVTPAAMNGMQESNGEWSKGEDIALTRVSEDVVAEGVFLDHSKQKLTKEQKGKGVIAHSSQEEISFSHALQQTFDPLIKAQKAKTWKRLNSSYGRGSKGVCKSSSFPISPKLSHVMVANAKYKLSPKISGGGKRKMEVDGDTGRSGGLLLMWNDDWEVSVKSFLAGHIDALVQCPGRRLWRFTRFETHWLKDEECHEIVHQTWLALDVLWRVKIALLIFLGGVPIG